MRRHGDYDLSATTNGPRFQSEVFLRLCRRDADRAPSTLFIDHGRTTLLTVYPDGRAEPGLPPDRRDLVALAERLEQRIDLAYLPMP
jgi:hypothetical protein